MNSIERIGLIFWYIGFGLLSASGIMWFTVILLWLELFLLTLALGIIISFIGISFLLFTFINQKHAKRVKSIGIFAVGLFLVTIGYFVFNRMHAIFPPKLFLWSIPIGLILLCIGTTLFTRNYAKPEDT